MHNGYGHILIHQEEETLTFDQLADQVFKNAQAGQPEAIAAIGEIADAQATLQWLATNWERNKTPLEKTNAQEKISPTAIALSDAHYSGKKYGGNCTSKDYNELEEKKVKYCSRKAWAKYEAKYIIYQQQKYATARILQNNAHLHVLQLIINVLLVEMGIAEQKKNDIRKFILNVLSNYWK